MDSEHCTKQDSAYEVGNFLLFVNGKVVAVSGNSQFYDTHDAPEELWSRKYSAEDTVMIVEVIATSIRER